MFLDPDEFLLIMDMNIGDQYPDVPLTREEMVLLKGAGVRTVYFQAAIRWDVMQPSAEAPLDWSLVDRFVEDAKSAGLKALIPFIYALPSWKPDEFFYSREREGLAYGVPNYSNPVVADELDELMLKVINRYSDDDIQVIFALPANGEFPLHCFCRHGQMDYPMGLFVDWVVDRQKILVDQHEEIWTAYHPYHDPIYWAPIYGELFSKFPLAGHYGITFTYVQHLARPHIQNLLTENQMAGMIYYGGTEYVQGMRENVPKLRAGGMRMLTAPKHPYQNHRAVEPWMLDEIRWALEQYL